jgi:hypothetical protein
MTPETTSKTPSNDRVERAKARGEQERQEEAFTSEGAPPLVRLINEEERR